eukprot:1157270-Pelagomonas_calceolata.AAC.14
MLALRCAHARSRAGGEACCEPHKAELPCVGAALHLVAQLHHGWPQQRAGQQKLCLVRHMPVDAVPQLCLVCHMPMGAVLGASHACGRCITRAACVIGRSYMWLVGHTLVVGVSHVSHMWLICNMCDWYVTQLCLTCCTPAGGGKEAAKGTEQRVQQGQAAVGGGRQEALLAGQVRVPSVPMLLPVLIDQAHGGAARLISVTVLHPCLDLRYDEEDADISLQIGADGSIEAERAAQQQAEMKRKLQLGGWDS